MLYFCYMYIYYIYMYIFYIHPSPPTSLTPIPPPKASSAGGSSQALTEDCGVTRRACATINGHVKECKAEVHLRGLPRRQPAHDCTRLHVA